MVRDDVKGPPAGFRTSIPTRVKLDAVIRQDGRCKECGERLGELAKTRFDHVPAIQLRLWCDETQDTIPPVNSPEHIEAKHVSCHDAKTTGRRGESRMGDKQDGDVPKIARIKRLGKKEAEFRARLLAKSSGEEPQQEQEKKKHQWPKRPFPKRNKDAKTRHGGKEGS